jgi:hypothetical protein
VEGDLCPTILFGLEIARLPPMPIRSSRHSRSASQLETL